MIRIQTILAPTDFSPPSRHALKYVAELARRFNAKVHLMTAIEPTVPLVPEVGILTSFDSDRVSAEQVGAQHALERIASDPMLTGVSVSYEVVLGHPDQEVLRVATERSADLLVLGTHGRTGLAHLFMGSVAEKIVRQSPCPVLTVRPEGHDFVSRK